MFSDLTHYIFQPPVPWRHRTALVYHLRWTTGRILLSLVIPSSTNSSWVFSQRSFSSKAAGRATPLGAAAAGGGRRRRKKAGPRDVGRREAPQAAAGGVRSSGRVRPSGEAHGAAGSARPTPETGRAPRRGGRRSAPAAEMRGESHEGPAGPCASGPPPPAPLRQHKGPRPLGRPRLPHLCPAAKPPKPPRHWEKRYAATRRRRKTTTHGGLTGDDCSGEAAWASGFGSRARAPPPGRAPPLPQTGEGPGCSLLRGPRPRLFSDFAQTVRPPPLPNPLVVLRGAGRVSSAPGRLERPPALCRVPGDGAAEAVGK